MSDVITLGQPARLRWRGCGCLRRDGGGGSRLVKRGSDLKCSKRSKLTQTSPQTSCLRVSLRQGNLAGAKGPRACGYVCVCVCVWMCVGQVSWAWSLAGEVGGGSAGAHVRWDSEMVCDGQGETRRISLVCLRERSSRAAHTHGLRSLSPEWILRTCVCVCVCVWHEGSGSGIWLVLCVGVCGSLRVTDPGAIFFSLA